MGFRDLKAPSKQGDVRKRRGFKDLPTTPRDLRIARSTHPYCAVLERKLPIPHRTQCCSLGITKAIIAGRLLRYRAPGGDIFYNALLQQTPAVSSDTDPSARGAEKAEQLANWC